MSILRTTSANKSSQNAQVYQQLGTDIRQSIRRSVNRKTETDIFSVTLLLPFQPKAIDSVQKQQPSLSQYIFGKTFSILIQLLHLSFIKTPTSINP